MQIRVVYSMVGGYRCIFLKYENTLNTVIFFHLFDFDRLQKPIIIIFFWINQAFKTSDFSSSGFMAVVKRKQYCYFGFQLHWLSMDVVRVNSGQNQLTISKSTDYLSDLFDNVTIILIAPDRLPVQKFVCWVVIFKVSFKTIISIQPSITILRNLSMLYIVWCDVKITGAFWVYYLYTNIDHNIEKLASWIARFQVWIFKNVLGRDSPSPLPETMVV